MKIRYLMKYYFMIVSLMAFSTQTGSKTSEALATRLGHIEKNLKNLQDNMILVQRMAMTDSGKLQNLIIDLRNQGIKIEES